MSLGVVNLPDIFIGMNNRLLHPSIGKFLLVYDNLVYCKSRCVHVKMKSYVLHGDILVRCMKLIEHDRQLGCIVGV